MTAARFVRYAPLWLVMVQLALLPGSVAAQTCNDLAIRTGVETYPSPEPALPGADWPASYAQRGLYALHHGDRGEAERQVRAFLALPSDAPLHGGMANGQALSLIVRLGWETEPTYRRLLDSIEDGWVMAGHSDSPVLNAHLYGVFGLYDYWQATGRGEPTLRLTLRTVLDNLRRFEPNWYDLDHSWREDERYRARRVAQLAILAAISDCEATDARTTTPASRLTSRSRL